MDKTTMTWVIVGMGGTLLVVALGSWCYFKQRRRTAAEINNQLRYYNEI